mgnify:CR=1 FL=1
MTREDAVDEYGCKPHLIPEVQNSRQVLLRQLCRHDGVASDELAERHTCGCRFSRELPDQLVGRVPAEGTGQRHQQRFGAR